MRSIMIILVAAGLVALVNSLPLVQNENFESPTLDQLTMVDDSNDETSHRTKRTIGILRQLFPEISQNVNRVGYQEQVEDTSGEASENNEVRVSFEDIQPEENEAIESELTPLDDESRNKRLVSLDGSSGGSGGSGSGSGNFLFDIIRLVAGSGSQPTDGTPSKTVEVDEAVPGPATRFLVVANRGISNLIQDLILRVAATSERFVNFKARLITSII